MKIYTEESLRHFEFWGGAKYTVRYLDYEDIDTIEEALEEMYPDGMSDTDINDFFWFEDDYIAEILGYRDFDALMKAKDGIEEEEEYEEEYTRENE